MNIKDFAQPTVLTGKQYGTTITIELDHSDTSIDEVMDGFLTIVKGLGYLDFTINEWIKDKAKDIYDDEHNTVTNLLKEEGEDFMDAYGWMNNGQTDDVIDWDTADDKRMDIIGQNGNEGTHYFATDADMDECELNDMSEEELRRKGYKGVYTQYPMHDCWCGEQTECDCISDPNDNDEYDDYGQRIEKDRPHFKWDEDEEELEDLVWPEPNEKLREAAKQYSKQVKEKHTPIKLDKTKVRKGKIKDLKK